MRDRFRSLLEEELAGAGIAVSSGCLERLAAHFRLLERWNRSVRLVGSTEASVVARRHMVESLLLLPFIAEPAGSLLDIGSGNGFPAVALKCALPALRLVMMEPTARKAAFLQVLLAELDLSHATVVRDRVDRASDLARHGRFDCITMRAVAAIRPVLDGAVAALRPAGRLIFLVGESGADLIAEYLRPPLELLERRLIPGRRASYIVVVGLAERRAA
ncbi:MAG: 16S rRNA (guanine(527)-N(7))-methyltransferase RsmG [Acidobacteriota bacterium]